LQRRILFVFGTRPEAIKLCPVIRHFREHAPDLIPRVCVTAQHRDLLDQVLEVFQIRPDRDLDLMLPGQSLFQSTSRIVAALEPVLAEERPDMLFVQGDTTTTFCGALAGFYLGIPVAHVEAGLRTWDLRQPFPEEMNRVLAGRLAALHFAATPWARDNLLREGVDPSAVSVTGNSGIDAVLYVRDALESGALRPTKPVETNPERRLILVTAHRRESFGAGFDRICQALHDLAERPDVEIVYPAHPNPRVREAVDRWLGGHPRVRVIEPLAYVEFVDLMRRAAILLTDSGGIQEEGPSLGKPILVLREKTERPEAVDAGTVRLVGTDRERIVSEVSRLLDDRAAYERMTRVHNPYGDGRASARILAATLSFFER
jgi:UDP-N-acetylglucosamine 2-epimerase (non-hydrolysing)